MNHIQQAIRDAAEKGGYRYRWWKVNDLEQNEGYNGLQLRALTEHLHDPDFWKALAKARKWEDANAWRNRESASERNAWLRRRDRAFVGPWTWAKPIKMARWHGGHLAGAMVATDWQALYPKAPPDLVPAG